MQLDPTTSSPQSLDQCPAVYIRIACGNVKQHRFQIPGSPSQEALNSFSSDGGACNLHSSPAPHLHSLSDNIVISTTAILVQVFLVSVSLKPFQSCLATVDSELLPGNVCFIIEDIIFQF